jgi:hypothetical protein
MTPRLAAIIANQYRIHVAQMIAAPQSLNAYFAYLDFCSRVRLTYRVPTETIIRAAELNGDA